MEKASLEFHLPKIPLKASLPDLSIMKKSSSRASIQNYLQEIRSHQLSLKRKTDDKRQEGYKRMKHYNEMYQRVSRRQVKKFEEREKYSWEEQEDILENQSVIVSVFRYDTIWKPPHRYKTAMTVSEDDLYVYGGFGAEKYLSLARFSLKKQDWEIPKIQEKSDLAVYSHTMATFRGILYIFGGIKMDSPTNQLIQINTKTSALTQLPTAPHRRRDHAMTFVHRFLTIQGGIEGQNEVKNTLFYFDTESGRWGVPQQYQLPFLSHHAIVTVPTKARRKNSTFQEVVGDALYIFGGKNERGVSSNRLYKLKVRESGDLTTQQIFAKGMPYPRHSACVQFIEPFYICIFGGRSDEQATAKSIKKGVFNDLVLFHIDRKQWITPSVNLQLPFRYGSSSCAFKNKFYIFGGNEGEGYSDGNVIQLMIGKDEEEEEDGILRKGKLRG